MNNQLGFLSAAIKQFTRAGRALNIGPSLQLTEPLLLAEKLLNDRGEASSLAIADQILSQIDTGSVDERCRFFKGLLENFGVDRKAIAGAIESWKQDEYQNARQVHFASEPRSQEIIRKLNRAPAGTERLLSMRTHLLDATTQHPDLKMLDLDFQHLFRSWFNTGFLELKCINWSTSAEVLEKIIAYEAVHEIQDWDDLRRRVAAPDRRLYGFFHPSLPTEPLIFVEVALTQRIPSTIESILQTNPNSVDPYDADTAVFYSISNCQKGLRGVPFGNFLIKQVVETLAREFEQLRTYVTLSPVPGLYKWLQETTALEVADLPIHLQEIIANFKQSDTIPDHKLTKLTAYYLTQAKRDHNHAADPVANFHLSNGAILHRILPAADNSERGRRASFGVMVNYMYDRAKIAANNENYSSTGVIAASQEVQSLLSAK